MRPGRGRYFRLGPQKTSLQQGPERLSPDSRSIPCSIPWLAGAQCNLAGLADALCWPQKFLPSVGRFVPFLRRCGVAPAGENDVVVGFF